MAGEYEDLQTESEFARQQLVSAMTSLETARVKAEAKSRYVVAFQIPVLPDELPVSPPLPVYGLRFCRRPGAGRALLPDYSRRARARRVLG